ncbi:SDR family NAD(P)-dependent oxidoreductase [Parabacteroides sp. OttesenSCG-928-G07]|nr:SDR family NAD(P)-dependent oxidoreductase [Parabacteroides sp. OttesenSCG-928-G21]MDL2277451.1 SDR family NAD(P)-dependent oxidoreductase [Parabacteroides sp. OttesenSCG-928-G07]
MKKIVIVGATSGIGLEIARIYKELGWRIGAAGRRREKLEQFQSTAPEQIVIEEIDVTRDDAVEQLHHLIEHLGGMDLFFLSSGIGYQNRALDTNLEQQTVKTNVEGFTRMVTAAYHYFQKQGGGHIAVISSIAGTKGLGAAPAYSATKRYQNTYIDALAQLSRMEKAAVTFTDIRPGFVRTDLLKDGSYPLQMQADYVARKIVRALQRKKRRVVIDWRYAILVFFWKLIPERLWERLSIHT